VREGTHRPGASEEAGGFGGTCLLSTICPIRKDSRASQRSLGLLFLTCWNLGLLELSALVKLLGELTTLSILTQPKALVRKPIARMVSSRRYSSSLKTNPSSLHRLPYTVRCGRTALRQRCPISSREVHAPEFAGLQLDALGPVHPELVEFPARSLQYNLRIDGTPVPTP
jgi:hypothetical protein